MTTTPASPATPRRTAGCQVDAVPASAIRLNSVPGPMARCAEGDVDVTGSAWPATSRTGTSTASRSHSGARGAGARPAPGWWPGPRPCSAGARPRSAPSAGRPANNGRSSQWRMKASTPSSRMRWAAWSAPGGRRARRRPRCRGCRPRPPGRGPRRAGPPPRAGHAAAHRIADVHRRPGGVGDQVGGGGQVDSLAAGGRGRARRGGRPRRSRTKARAGHPSSRRSGRSRGAAPSVGPCPRSLWSRTGEDSCRWMTPHDVQATRWPRWSTSGCATASPMRSCAPGRADPAGAGPGRPPRRASPRAARRALGRVPGAGAGPGHRAPGGGADHQRHRHGRAASGGGGGGPGRRPAARLYRRPAARATGRGGAAGHRPGPPVRAVGALVRRPRVPDAAGAERWRPLAARAYGAPRSALPPGRSR